MIDLHSHSTFSDGSFSPTELAELASAAGLRALALTDHDTLGGIPEFMAATERCGMLGIPGVEISAEFNPGTMHMLGYFIDIENQPLQEHLLWIREGRAVRNQLILEKLRSLGLDISWDLVAAQAAEDIVARPHFAKALIKAGYVKNKQEAFNRYLAKGKRAYIDRRRPEPRDAIKFISNAGGVPVLAHPVTLGVGVKKLKELLGELKTYGLKGMECYYPEHKPSQTARYVALCKELDLVACGGSDFHGDLNPLIKLGRGFGNLSVPFEVLDELSALSSSP